MYNLVSLVTGLVFGLGLIVSGLVNPAKVLGFLDLAGAWDPSLIFVMAGAIAVAAGAFAMAGRRSATLLGGPVQLPTSRTIDARLIAGSTVFGIGWGIAGLCPGPALVVLGAGKLEAVVFVAAMIVGMAVFEASEARARNRRDAVRA